MERKERKKIGKFQRIRKGMGSYKLRRIRMSVKHSKMDGKTCGPRNLVRKGNLKRIDQNQTRREPIVNEDTVGYKIPSLRPKRFGQ